jgi:flagellar FliL protein
VSKEAAPQEADATPSDGSEPTPAAPGRRKKLLIIGAILLLLLGGGGGTAWFFLKGAAQKDKVSAEEARAEAEAEAPVEFVDVPPMQVALRGADGSNRMLKLHVMLVPGDKTGEEITPRLPMLVDRFQPFLRELRPEDMAGSAATFRIKEELLIRANQALGPRAVRDVLIQDLMQS